MTSQRRRIGRKMASGPEPASGLWARVLERVVEQKLITAEDSEELGGLTPRWELGAALVDRGVLSERALTELLSELAGLPSIDFADMQFDEKARGLISADLARVRGVFPLSVDETHIELAMADPLDFHTIQDVEFALSRQVRPRAATPTAISKAIKHAYGDDDVIQRMIEDIAHETSQPAKIEVVEADTRKVDLGTSEEGSTAPVVRLVNMMISEALRLDASDIHIEPLEDMVRVRYRVDGVLRGVASAEKSIQLALASRIKIMSQLDISETRRPQDGRIKLRFRVEGQTRELDLRVSTAPMLWGEKIVMRLLVPDKLNLDLGSLGFEPSSLDRFKAAANRPHGIVLVTGPTGSGKTNTLYSTLSGMNTMDVNILTVEDPVEFNLPGINQLPVKESVGVTFASALRTFLRQDPDVILIGEMRDSETADIGVRAALTGHLVLSTLHTNDAPSSIGRLIDMGVEPFLLASSLQVVVAQRLVRRLCTKCRVAHDPDPETLAEVGFDPAEFDDLRIYRAGGCEDCNQTGYRGRIGLFEVMSISEEIRTAISAGQPTRDLEAIALREGMLTLRQSGLEKVRAGITSLDEVLSTTQNSQQSNVVHVAGREMLGDGTGTTVM
jgi:type IV pilus assembly protein PilB